MTTNARLQSSRRWGRAEDGSPQWARVLCGKRDLNGDQRCRASLCTLLWPTSTEAPEPPALLFPVGSLPDGNGVWRPSRIALLTYREQGVLAPPSLVTFERQLIAEPIRARYRTARVNGRARTPKPTIIVATPPHSEVKHYFEILSPEPVAAVCPRCGVEQNIRTEELLAAF